MYILRNNKIIKISTTEDSHPQGIIAVKTREELDLARPGYEHARNEIASLTWDENSHSFSSGPDHYIFRITQSPYRDNSGLKSGFGMNLTIGDAIQYMLTHGFKVYNGETEILAHKVEAPIDDLRKHTLEFTKWYSALKFNVVYLNQVLAAINRGAAISQADYYDYWLNKSITEF